MLPGIRWPDNFEKLRRPARPIILEHADHQPARLPGQPVKVGLAARDDWRLRVSVVSMHDVAVAVAQLKPFGVSLP